MGDSCPPRSCSWETPLLAYLLNRLWWQSCLPQEQRAACSSVRGAGDMAAGQRVWDGPPLVYRHLLDKRGCLQLGSCALSPAKGRPAAALQQALEWESWGHNRACLFRPPRWELTAAGQKHD